MPITDPPYLYGDSAVPIGGRTSAGSEVLVAPAGVFPQLIAVGDAPALIDRAHGGDDTLSANSVDTSVAIGDALTIGGHASGGDDHVNVLARGHAEAYGDALDLADHAQGGDDVVNAGSRFGSFAYGDARVISDHASGGNDTVTGSADLTATLFGDAETMSGWARGGDDVVRSTSSFTFGSGDVLYGDARVLTDHAVGGNDTLTGAAGPTAKATLYGDGEQLLGHARGGDDVLIGGPGQDIMWGDAAVVAPGAHTGSDRFVFSPGGSHDQIMDFQPGKDVIELDGFGIHDFNALAAHMQDTAQGVLIAFDPADDVLVRGVHLNQLGAGDFLFG